MAAIATQTPYVAGRSSELGNPSPVTAKGVFHGIEAGVAHQLHQDNLKDVRVLIQGVGKVGHALAKLLHDAGAKIIVSDINADLVKATTDLIPSATVVDPENVYSTDCDVFAPCSLGGILNHKTIPQLKCKIVAGGANNQLGNKNDGQLLLERDIIYAPDYVINSGGLIFAAAVYSGQDIEKVNYKTENIYSVLKDIYRVSKEKNMPTNLVADQLAKEKIAQGVKP